MISEKFPVSDLPKKFWPKSLSQIPQPPKRLFIRGLENFKKMREDGIKFLCVVGPRKYSEYGKEVCEKIISDLSGFPICIVSGLAYGIDSIAHEIALDNNIKTIAFPGSGLDWDVIYPQAHLSLGKNILNSGGSLISEFASSFKTLPWMFPQRNRLMTGISDMVLIIEATEKSGTTITANMAVEYDKTLGCIPGSIFNPNCKATNRFIKQGAFLISSAEDILENLGFDITKSLQERKIDRIINLTEEEKMVLISFRSNRDISEVSRQTNFDISKINAIITRLEIMELI